MIAVGLQQVNRYLWERQGFDLRRSWEPSAALNAQLGLYGFGPSLYPGLLARYRDLSFSEVGRALDEERSLVRLDGMRLSLFAVPRPLFPVLVQAYRQNHTAFLDRFLAKFGLSGEEIEQLTERALALLQDQNLTTAQIKKVLAPLSTPAQAGFSYLLARAAAQGLVVRARTRGSWKSTQFEWALLENWLPGLDLEALDPAEARLALAREYFAAYGPATLADFRWWSGLSAEEAAATLESLAEELVRIEIRGLEGEYLLRRQDLEALLACPEEGFPPEAPALSLLPVWDAYLMAYRSRRRYLEEACYDRVYDRSGNCAPVILLNGSVAGVWDLEDARGTITVKGAFFETQDGLAWEAFRQAATRLGAALLALPEEAAWEEGRVRLLRCPPPPSLASASQNRFHFPLRDIHGEEI